MHQNNILRDLETIHEVVCTKGYRTENDNTPELVAQRIFHENVSKEKLTAVNFLRPRELFSEFQTGNHRLL